MALKYLIRSNVDLLREPVTCRTEGPSNVTSLHHLHQVSDDLSRRLNRHIKITHLIRSLIN